MTDIHAGPEGATSLEPDERDGLIPTYVATCEELNAHHEPARTSSFTSSTACRTALAEASAARPCSRAALPAVVRVACNTQTVPQAAPGSAFEGPPTRGTTCP